MAIETSNAGMDNHKSAFLQIIHANVRQLTDFMRNELSMPSSYDEEILGREVAKVISYMAFNIDPLQVDVSADATINQFLRDTNNLTNISKYKNFRFYKLLSDNLNAVAACFGIYFITRVESIKGFAFVLPVWLATFLGTEAGRLAVKHAPEAVNYLKQLKTFIDTNFGPGDFGKDLPGGIYYFYKYFKNQPYFGYAAPIKEGTSIGWFKNNWKPVIENESGVAFDVATEYFLKYYSYIKSGYFKNQNEWYVQMRKDIADKAAGRNVSGPANLGGSSDTRSFLSRLFGR